MTVRYSLGVVGLMIACGGSSKHEGKTNGNDDSGGASGQSSGGSPVTGHGGSSGGSGASSSGTSGSAGDLGGTGIGANGGVGASAGTKPAGGGVSGNAGELPEGCGPGGCIAGSMNTSLNPPPGPVRCGGVECQPAESCCIGTLRCFSPDTEADACPPPPLDDDPWGRTPCSSNAHCSPGWFCALDGSLCQGAGHCQPSDNCGSCEDGGSGVCRVCACDGNTYPSTQAACLAGAFAVVSGAGCGEPLQVGGAGAGGKAGSSGVGGQVIIPCGTSDDCTRDGEVCCGLTARCYPKSDPQQCVAPPEGTRFPCTSNAQCNDYELCQGDGGCTGPGGCVSRSNDDCGVLFDPVCGCDGASYTSAACARQRGVRVASQGECKAK